MRNNYIVQYIAFDATNRILKHGKMRCKDCLSEFDAQAGLEKYFEKTLAGFKKLTVLSVRVESSTDWLDNIFRLYNK